MQFEFPKTDDSWWAFDQEGASIFKKATRYCGSKSEGSENVVQSRLEELLPVFYLGMIFVVGYTPSVKEDHYGPISLGLIQ